MSFRSHQRRMPSVFVAESEYERLWNLAEASTAPGAAFLGDELARATVVREGDRRAGFVRLGSRVAFRDLTTGRARQVVVVAPDEADIDADRLSVVTPVGAALIGLRPGDSIGMRTIDGKPHVLQVEAVDAAAVAA